MAETRVHVSAYIIYMTHCLHIKALRKHLLEELEQAFPDEVEDYREIRAASAAVSSVTLLYYFLHFGFLSLL